MAENQTIIIKKIKKGGHGGHHGGAWKVAYADFVTAMMAFFLLLWLLNATPAETLEGVADYFAPTLGVKGNTGSGTRNGNNDTPKDVKTSQSSGSGQGVIYGTPPTGPLLKINDEENVANEDLDANRFDAVQQDLQKKVEEEEKIKEYQDSILIDQTPEGLRIQLLDQDKHPMFIPGGTELQPAAKFILQIITSLIRYIPHYISITGHTNTSMTTQYDNNAYSVWELSTDRANVTRRFIISVGLDAEQVIKVVGKADTDPIDSKDPASSRNRRIEIILLKKAKLPSNKKPAEDSLNDSRSNESEDASQKTLKLTPKIQDSQL